MGSSFCSFTRLNLQNEDRRPHENVLFDVEILKSMRSSFLVLPASNYKTKTLSKMPVSVL